MKPTSRTVLPLCSVALLAGQAAEAAILSLDFGTDTSLVEPGFVGMSVTGSQSFSGLSGVASGSITVAFPVAGTRDRGGPLDSGAFTYGDLYRDLFTGLSETSTGTTLSISGLDPLTSYRIQLWSVDHGFNNGSTYSWYDTTATPVLLGQITNSSPAAPTTNDDFSLSAVLTSDATGQILLGHTDPAGTGVINALVIDAVPEPSVFLLAGLATLGFAGFRTRPR